MKNVQAIHSRPNEMPGVYEARLVKAAEYNYRKVQTILPGETGQEMWARFCDWENNPNQGVEFIKEQRMYNDPDNIFEERFDLFCRCKRDIYRLIDKDFFEMFEQGENETLEEWYDRVKMEFKEDSLIDFIHTIRDHTNGMEWYSETLEEFDERRQKYDRCLTTIQSKLEVEPDRLKFNSKAEEAKACEQARQQAKDEAEAKIKAKKTEEERDEKRFKIILGSIVFIMLIVITLVNSFSTSFASFILFISFGIIGYLVTNKETIITSIFEVVDLKLSSLINTTRRG